MSTPAPRARRSAVRSAERRPPVAAARQAPTPGRPTCAARRTSSTTGPTFRSRKAWSSTWARSTSTRAPLVIAGSGLAGGVAAKTLRDDGYTGRIVLIGDEPGLPFGRPPLSKTYLRGEEELSGWLVE